MTKMSDLYTLPALPYAYEALEPWCAAETLHLHHGKHHAAYVRGANESAAALDEVDTSNAVLLAGLQASFTFNLGGHTLHSLFWPNLSPESLIPSGPLATQIQADFGSTSRLCDVLTATSIGLQGSGWGALVRDNVAGVLRVAAIKDHQQGLVSDTSVLAVVDVWEHAYYLGYKNDRASWVRSVVAHLNWDVIAERFAEIRLV